MRRQGRGARGLGLGPQIMARAAIASSSSGPRRRPQVRWPRSRIIALTSVLVAAGCTSSSLFESDAPVPTSYVLAAAPAAQDPGVPAAVDLSIGRPSVAPGLDSERIAVLKGRQLDYYRGVKWGGRMPEVIQTLIVDSLQDQRLFRSVVAEQARVASDYVLDISVRDFQAEYGQDAEPPVVRVTITGRLIRIVDRELVHTMSVQAQSPAAENRMGAVAAAFEAAARDVALDLARKTSAAVVADDQNLRAARGESD